MKRPQQTPEQIASVRIVPAIECISGCPVRSQHERELLKLREANDLVGPWLSAALDDPDVCEEMKESVRAWFEATDAVWRTLKGLPFTREQWFKLPMDLRIRWWNETDYSKLDPSPELLGAMQKAIEAL